MPSAARASAIPATRGASGPMATRPAACFFAAATRPGTSLSLTSDRLEIFGWQLAVPPLPGATSTLATAADLASARACAISRPPEPTTMTVAIVVAERCAWRCERVRSLGGRSPRRQSAGSRWGENQGTKPRATRVPSRSCSVGYASNLAVTVPCSPRNMAEAAAPGPISIWQRAVLAVKHATEDRVEGTCFVIDAVVGLLWSCSHVVGEVVGETWQIGMASAPGQPITWMYEARVVHSTPKQPGLDGALLRITLSGPLCHVAYSAVPHVLLLHPLTHADGQPMSALPLGDDTELRLPGDEPAILLGYPAVTKVVTPTVGIYSNRTSDGEFLLTDSVMLPGHSGGPGLNQQGEVVGWNVRQATRQVSGLYDGNKGQGYVRVRFANGQYEDRASAGTFACGVNELRPVSRLVAELQALQGQAAQEAFGGSVPADVRGFLTAKPGCITAPTAFASCARAPTLRSRRGCRQLGKADGHCGFTSRRNGALHRDTQLEGTFVR